MVVETLPEECHRSKLLGGASPKGAPSLLPSDLPVRCAFDG